MKIALKHFDNFKFNIIPDTFGISIDQATEYGGDGTGPMPSEILLWSVAGCIGQTIVFIAGKKNLELKNLEIHVEGNKNNQTFRLDSIDVHIHCDCKIDVLENILNMAKKYCFVSNTITKGTRINYKTKGVE